LLAIGQDMRAFFDRHGASDTVEIGDKQGVSGLNNEAVGEM
jgi:hypothetical protein